MISRIIRKEIKRCKRVRAEVVRFDRKLYTLEQTLKDELKYTTGYRRYPIRERLAAKRSSLDLSADLAKWRRGE